MPGNFPVEAPAARWTKNAHAHQRVLDRTRRNEITSASRKEDVREVFETSRLGRTKALLLAALRIWELKNGIRN